MKSPSILPGLTALALGAGLQLHAQVTDPGPLIGFTSGSDGSYGPIDITANTTLAIPPDGLFRATTIKVAAGATLRFQRNANNTPVYLLATGPVQIDGTLDVSGSPGTATTAGEPGPGGFPGGMPPSTGNPPGDGQGPGGGPWQGGRGSPASHQTLPDPAAGPAAGLKPYGDALGIPPCGGSGGSGWNVTGQPRGGGGGGGAITLASDKEIVVGASSRISAEGGGADEGGHGAGSGGRIRLVAPKVNGTGIMSVQGGATYRGAPAGAGWIRIDRLDRSPLQLQYVGAGPALGAVMMALPTPAPQLRIKSVDGVAVDPTLGAVTIIRPQGAPLSFPVVIEARDFRAQVPTQLYIVPDNATRTVLTATLDTRSAGSNPTQHTFTATVPPNMRTTLQVFAGKSLPLGL